MNKSKFTNAPYVKRVEKPWGYELMHLKAGIRQGGVLMENEKGNTYRLQDDYARPNETEEMRKKPNRGWK